jgi:hypothetical protein
MEQWSYSVALEGLAVQEEFAGTLAAVAVDPSFAEAEVLVVAVVVEPSEAFQGDMTEVLAALAGFAARSCLAYLDKAGRLAVETERIVAGA